MVYSELKTAVTDYLHRSDLASQVATFIARAELYLFRQLDIKATETSTSGVTSGASIALPSDCAQVTRVSVTTSGVEASLDYFAQPVDYVSGLTAPNYFSLESGALRLHDAPGTGYTYTLYYIPVIAPLSDTVTTNWLLANAPDLYLYAVALEGARYVRNAQEVDKLGPLVNMLIESVRSKAARRHLPMGGSLQIKPRR